MKQSRLLKLGEYPKVAQTLTDKIRSKEKKKEPSSTETKQRMLYTVFSPCDGAKQQPSSQADCPEFAPLSAQALPQERPHGFKL